MPDRVGRFLVRQLLGQGAFGRVYRAYDPQLEREVALKLPRPGTFNSPRRVQRFIGDAKAAARLRHPNIVPVFDIGQVGAQWFIASAFVEGHTLAEAIDRDELDPPAAARIVRSLAEALAYAHQQGIVHRDVKPDNVMLDARREPHLIDFGLAKRGEEGETGRAVMGTAPYMPPEQASGRSGEASPASDQYSLGATLYELLCGRTPFGGPTDVVLYNVVHSPLPPVRGVNPAVPLDLALVCEKALAKRPQDRYPSCRVMAEDLRRWLDGETPRVRRLSPAQRLARWVRRQPGLATAVGVAAAAVLAIAALGVAFALSTAGKNRDLEAANEKESSAREAANRSAEVARDAEQAARRNERAALRELASSHFDRATALSEQGEVGQGLAWFAESLRVANTAGDADLESAVRESMAAWRHQLHGLARVQPLTFTALAAAFDRRGEFFALAGETRAGGHAGGTVQFFRAGDGEPLDRSITLDAPVRALALDPDARLLLTSGDAASEVRVWSTADASPVGRPLGQPGGAGVRALAVSPDGTAVLAGCDDGRAYLWRLPGRGKITAESLAGEGLQLAGALWHPVGHSVGAVAFHPHPGRLVALTGSEPKQARPGECGEVRKWDLTDGPSGPVKTLSLPLGVKAVAFHPAGSVFGTACGTLQMGEARLWSAETLEPVPGAVFPHQAEVYALAFSRDGRHVVTGGQDRMVRVWSAATFRPVGQPLWHNRDVHAVAVSPDGRGLVSAGGESNYRLWSLALGLPVRTTFEPDRPVVTARLTGAGDRALLERLTRAQLLGRPPAVELLAADGRAAARLEPGAPVGACASSADGTVIALAEGVGPGLVSLWTDQGVCTGRTRVFPDKVWSVALDPAGRHVAVGYHNGDVRVWAVDALDGDPALTLTAHTDRVYACAFSPDGATLLTGGRDRAARLWDAATGRCRAAWDLPDVVLSGVFAADGRALLVGYAGGAQFYRWNGQAPPKPEGAALPLVSGILQVDLAADGRTALTGGTDGALRRWHLPTGKPLGPAWRHPGLVRAAQFGPGRTAFGAWMAMAGGRAELLELPEPVEGNAERVRLWARAVTGVRLEDGAASAEDGERWWQDVRALRGAAGGPPAIEAQLADRRAKEPAPPEVVPEEPRPPAPPGRPAAHSAPDRPRPPAAGPPNPARTPGPERYLPGDTSLVVSFNVRQFLGSELAQRYALQPLRQAMAGPEAQRVLKDLGLDPLRDVTRVTVAVGAGGPEKPLILVRGMFDRREFEARAFDFARENPERLRAVREADGPVYEVVNAGQPGQSLFVATLDADTVAASPDRAAVLQARSQGHRKGVSLGRVMQDLIAAADDRTSLWLAATPQALAEKMPLPNPQVRQEIEKVAAVTGSVNVTGDVRLDIVLTASTDDAARDLSRKLEEGLTQVKGALPLLLGQQEEMKPVIDLVNSLKLSTKDKTITLQGGLSASEIESALRKR
jgi:WD40 repeat protein